MGKVRNDLSNTMLKKSIPLSLNHRDIRFHASMALCMKTEEQRYIIEAEKKLASTY